MYKLLIAALLALSPLGPLAHAAPAPLWTLSGFANPESAAYAAKPQRIYVSNVAGEPLAKDGNGFISLVSADGKMLDAHWKTGLNAPKGIAVKGGLLYVADIDELLEIDTGNKRIIRRFKPEGAKFLNDVTVLGDVVYVSDMLTNVIWQLKGNTLSALSRDPALENPNGLLAEKGQLVVASWGVMTDGFKTATPGHLKAVDLNSGTVQARFAPIPLGNLDGLISDGQGGYVVSDWMNGNIFRITAKGETQLWLPLEPGTADIGSIPGKAVLVPNMQQGTLTAYPVDWAVSH